MSKTKISETILDVADLDYHAMPQDQGQIVTYSYAVHPNGLLVCRRHDSSDQTTTYQAAEIDEDGETPFEPWNGTLPDHGEMEEVIADGTPLASMLRAISLQDGRFTGNCAADEAQDWLDHDFDADSAESWWDIGCWDAATAAEWRDAKLTPSQIEIAAKKLREEENKDDVYDHGSEYTDGPIYAACNGDILAERLIEAAR